MKCMIHKVQCVVPVTADERDAAQGTGGAAVRKSGSLLTITPRGSKSEILEPGGIQKSHCSTRYFL